MDTEENVINNDINLNKKEEDSLSFSFISEDNYKEVLTFNNINFYEDLKYEIDIDFDNIDNKNNCDEEDNFSIISFSNEKEIINEEDNYFNIDNIEKERGFLTLFISIIII